MSTTLVQPFSRLEQIIMDPEHKTTGPSLREGFGMKDLNEVHRWLWIVGSPGNISPLHHQKVLLREIIATERARLHLVWFDRVIYVKPLHDYLLNTECYESFICKDGELHALIIGFLQSYLSLIQTPVDLKIAKDHSLIATTVTWTAWNAFRDKVLSRTRNTHVNKRYEYGELRLGRLDLIWRFTGRGSCFFTVHRNYKTYFDHHFAFWITIFVFTTAILSAMQVVTGIERIPGLLRTVSYRFSIAVLVSACLCFGYLMLTFMGLFLFNLLITMLAHRHCTP